MSLLASSAASCITFVCCSPAVTGPVPSNPALQTGCKLHTKLTVHTLARNDWPGECSRTNGTAIDGSGPEQCLSLSPCGSGKSRANGSAISSAKLHLLAVAGILIIDATRVGPFLGNFPAARPHVRRHLAPRQLLALLYCTCSNRWLDKCTQETTRPHAYPRYAMSTGQRAVSVLQDGVLPCASEVLCGTVTCYPFPVGVPKMS